MARPLLRVTTRQFRPRKAAKLNLALLRELDSIFNTGAKVFLEVLGQNLRSQTGETFGALSKDGLQVGASIRERRGTAPPKKGKKPLNRRTGEPIGEPGRNYATGFARGDENLKMSFQTSPDLRFEFEYTIPTFQFALHDAGRAKGSGTMEGASEKAEAVMVEFIELNISTRVAPIIGLWFSTGQVRTLA